MSVVIVGAGQAGGNVAATLRAEGYSGAITLVGAETYPPYERPPLSKELLKGKAEPTSTYLRPVDFYGAANIDLKLGVEVVAINREKQQVEFRDASTKSYEHLVLATGTRPRMLSLPGSQSSYIHYLRTLQDAARLQDQLKNASRMVVIGGGFIGLEVAASARSLGVDVVVLEQAPALMGRSLPPQVAEYLASRHKQEGVVIHTGIKILGFVAADAGVHVVTDQQEPLFADCVVVGIGAIPNTELARACGLDVNDGVVVDEFGRTSGVNVYAAGDVTRHYNPLLNRHIRLESWQNAQNQGIAVARTIAGNPVAYAEIPWLWSDQYDINLQTAGLPEDWNEPLWRGKPEDGRFMVFAMRGRQPMAAIAVNLGRDMRFARQIITRGTEIDTGHLADPAVALQTLAK